MKRTLITAAAVTVLALGASSPSLAQGVGVQVGPIGAGISFAPEQRTRIREYVVRERVAPIRERVTVGARFRPSGARPSRATAMSTRANACTSSIRQAARSCTSSTSA